MKSTNHFFFSMIVLLGICFLVTAGFVNATTKPAIVLYDTDGFWDNSSKVVLDKDIPNLKVLSFNDKTSSIALINGLKTAAVYQHANYLGKCMTVTENIKSLKETSIGNDSISSVRLNTSCSAVPKPPIITNGVILYQHINYGGDKLIVQKAHPDLRMDSFNDKASSAKLIDLQKAALYEDINFQGKCYTITKDTPTLVGTEIGNDKVSSIKPGEECVPQSSFAIKNLAPFISKYVIEYPDGRVEKNITTGLMHKYNFNTGTYLKIKVYYVNLVDSPYAWNFCDFGVSMSSNKKMTIKSPGLLADPQPSMNLCVVEELP